jgi:putative DNA primase/helicase
VLPFSDRHALAKRDIMHLDFSTISWVEKLIAAGIDGKRLKNTAGPCPLCGGKDRFRFDNKGNQGTYFCSGCGAGNGYKLVKEFTGWTAVEVLKFLQDGGALNLGEPAKKFTFEDAAFSPKQVAANQRVLRATGGQSFSLDGADAASRYLKMRVPGCDLARLSDGLRFHRGMDFWEDDGHGESVHRGKFAALLGNVVDGNGEQVTIHRTYLTAAGEKAPFANVKKQMKGVRKLDGAAVRVVEVASSRTLGLTEGIENAAAVGTAYRYGINVWSTLNCVNLAAVDIPVGRFDKIVIFADHDKLDPKTERRPGEHYALLLKARLEEAGYEVEIKMPPEEGVDFADMWVQHYQKRQASRLQAAQVKRFSDAGLLAPLPRPRNSIAAQELCAQ